MNILFFIKPKANVKYLNSFDTIGEALEVISKERFSTYPVISKEGYYKATLSEGDVLRYLFENNFVPIDELYKTPIMKIPRRFDFKSIDINNKIEDLLATAKDQSYVPIKDGENKFIGIICRSEIIEYFNNKKD